MKTRTDQVPEHVAHGGVERVGPQRAGGAGGVRDLARAHGAGRGGTARRADPEDSRADRFRGRARCFIRTRPDAHAWPSRKWRCKSYLARVSLAATGLLRHAGHQVRPRQRPRHAVLLLRVRRGGERGGGGRLHRARTACGAWTSSTTRAARCNEGIDRGQIEGGFIAGHGLADVRGIALGQGRPAADARAEHVQDSRVRRHAGGFPRRRCCRTPPRTK